MYSTNLEYDCYVNQQKKKDVEGKNIVYLLKHISNVIINSKMPKIMQI